jgi:hypothetical protein
MEVFTVYVGISEYRCFSQVFPFEGSPLIISAFKTDLAIYGSLKLVVEPDIINIVRDSLLGFA